MMSRQAVRERTTHTVNRVRERAGGAPHPETVVVCLVAAAVCLYGIGNRPLWIWDESFYAVAAVNAVEGGHWIVPHTAGFDELGAYPFLEKPPLAIWLQALSIWGLGATEFAVRAPSALAAAATAGLVYVVGARIDRRTVGILAAAVFLSTPAVLVGVNGARFGATDTLHTLLGSLVVTMVWFQATGCRRYPIPLYGVTVAGLLLTKGFAAGVFAVAAFPLIVARFDRFGLRFLIGVSAIVVVTVVPWGVAAYTLEGGYFIEEIFLEQVWRRLTGDMSTVTYQTAVPLLKYPYATIAQERFWPWWFIFLGGIVVSCRRSWGAWRNETASHTRLVDTLVPLWWALAVFLLFGLTGTASWYLIPMYVPAALVVARVLADAADGRRDAVVATVVSVGVVLAAGVDRYLYRPGAEGGIDIVLNRGGVALSAAAVIVLLVAASRVLATEPTEVGVRRLAGGISIDIDRFVHLIAVSAILCLAVGGLVGVPSVYAADTGGVEKNGFDQSEQERDMAFRTFGEQSETAVPAGETIYVERSAEINWFYSSYAFYASRPLAEASIKRLRTDPKVRYAILTPGGESLIEERDPEVLARSETLGISLARLGPPPGS
jgi:4-amino-4-deoxy-L-arabinose transferase-like glycosyltransferase